MKKKKRKLKKGKRFENIEHDHFINRETSWLEFNARVLAMASDESIPLLERIRFLTIFTSNQDEFVMKRVGGLREQIAAGYSYPTLDGLTPREQLNQIREKIKDNNTRQNEVLLSLFPQLKEQGIELLKWSHLDEQEKQFATEYFKEKVYPILTPLSVDPGHPFPFISNLSLSLGVRLRNPAKPEMVSFSRVKIPDVVPSLLELPNKDEKKHRFLRLGELVEHNLSFLFPGMEIISVMLFRVTRNAELAHDDEDAEDLLEVVEESLRERRFAECIRLEHKKNPDKWMLKFLKKELKLLDDDVYELENLIDYKRLSPIVNLDLPELKYKPWTPITPKILMKETGIMIFDKIKAQDILIHHPYESFGASVERFITSAALDPNVLAIKMTLYRTGDSSPIVRSLIRAAENGKQVVCLIELKARFDEQRNIYWAQKLEDAGVHVVYGIIGLKTHTKISLVVRKEQNDLMTTYAHIGTGNYNGQTAKVYTDFSLLTCNRKITSEVIEVFNYITGRSLKADYQKLLVAPLNMKSTFLNLIQKEISNAKAGKPAYIYAKMNQLEDLSIIQKLYEASGVGVKIELVVRGFCCLRPGVKGISENITVRSIIGRFLEHSRIYVFAAGHEDLAKAKVYMGSADWMHRNLHKRVEVITPIEAEIPKQRVLDFVYLTLEDNDLTWMMNNDGSYEKSKTTTKKPINIHNEMMKKTLKLESPH
jgi:polyphosphate kinase